MKDIIELRWILQVIRRWLWLIGVCVLLAAISASVISSQMPSTYSASATMLVQVAPAAGESDYYAIRTSGLLLSTYSQMLAGRPVMNEVIAQLDLQETPDTLAKRVEVELIQDTHLIRLTVKHTDPTYAALIANTIAETFIAQLQALQAERYADSLAGIQVHLVELSAQIEEAEA